jgi:hypothetical protein
MAQDAKSEDYPNEGWCYIPNARKWHYIMSTGRSLCGRWLWSGKGYEQGNNNSVDNCAACRRKLIANIIPRGVRL